ncbi:MULTISPECIES: type II secretion system protein GspL [unclassified Marinovum]
MQVSQELKPDLTAPSAGKEDVAEPANPPSDAVPLPATILPAAMIEMRTAGREVAVISALGVGLHAVHVPLRGQAQRRAALPYALEEANAAPVDATHHALCGSLAEGHVLAAVLSKVAMTQALAEAGGKPVVPEQFLLPAPEGGDALRWAVWRVADKALVRASDGTGFGVRVDMLAHLWKRAGQPLIDSYGAALPSDITAQERQIDDLAPSADLPDLRQGEFAPAQKLRAPLTALILCGVLALVAHLGLAFADLQRLRSTADDLRAEAQTLLSRNVPTARVTDDPRLLYRQLAAGGQAKSGFLSVFGTLAEALGDAPIQLSNLSWSGRDGTLTLQAEAAGIAVLQGAEAALVASPLGVSTGAVTAGEGSARMTLTVRAQP